jgi:hypothetical protein
MRLSCYPPEYPIPYASEKGLRLVEKGQGVGFMVPGASRQHHKRPSSTRSVTVAPKIKDCVSLWITTEANDQGHRGHGSSGGSINLMF